MSAQRQRRALILSPYWAPSRVTALWRPLRLCRYLPEFGWAPTVLAPRPEDLFHFPPPVDDALSVPQLPVLRPALSVPSVRLMGASATLGERLDQRLGFGRARSADRAPRRLPRSPGALLEKLAIRLIGRSRLPDQFAEWGLSAVRQLRLGRLPELASLRGQLDALWVTGGPFGAFVAGALLADQLRCPLVLDYRDMWTSDPDLTTHRPLFAPQGLIERLEGALLERASAVAYIHAPCLEANRRRFGQPAGSRWEVIPNSFDPIDLGTAAPITDPVPNLLYAGNCYGSRSLSPCLDALAAYPREEASPRLEVFGVLDRASLDALAARPLPPERFTYSPPVSAQEIGARLRGAAALLLIIGETHREALSAKLYDYLAAGRPIIGYGPADAAARAVVESLGAAGRWVVSGDQEGLLRAYRDVAEGRLTPPVAPPTERYHARQLAARSAALLDWAARQGPRPSLRWGSDS